MRQRVHRCIYFVMRLLALLSRLPTIVYFLAPLRLVWVLTCLSRQRQYVTFPAHVCNVWTISHFHRHVELHCSHCDNLEPYLQTYRVLWDILLGWCDISQGNLGILHCGLVKYSKWGQMDRLHRSLQSWSLCWRHAYGTTDLVCPRCTGPLDAP